MCACARVVSGEGELSNKSFSLKRITDDDGLRANESRGDGRQGEYMTGFRRKKRKEKKKKNQIKLETFCTFSVGRDGRFSPRDHCGLQLRENTSSQIAYRINEKRPTEGSLAIHHANK